MCITEVGMIIHYSSFINANFMFLTAGRFPNNDDSDINENDNHDDNDTRKIKKFKNGSECSENNSKRQKVFMACVKS